MPPKTMLTRLRHYAIDTPLRHAMLSFSLALLSHYGVCYATIAARITCYFRDAFHATFSMRGRAI